VLANVRRGVMSWNREVEEDHAGTRCTTQIRSVYVKKLKSKLIASKFSLPT